MYRSTTELLLQQSGSLGGAQSTESLKDIVIFDDSRIRNQKSSRHQKQLPGHGPV